ncbi:MAG TPA: ABC transporter permease [Candidatus Acidoferrum sp.]|jgi:predicted permease|nr:ABC transporter permease [Candidatus Acidoferrum sp.]
MALLVKARSFLRNLFLSRRVDVDLDQEVLSHLEMLTDENIRAGMPPKEAQRAARIELGGIEQVKEQVREQRIGNWLHSVISDCRYGLRQLRKNPGFTTVAVLTLALGIGANTAIFQLIDAVRLRTLPVKDPQELATVRIVDRSWAYGRTHGRYAELTNAIWEQIRDRQQVFSSVFAWAGEELNIANSGEVRYVEGIWVSGDYFKALEVPALIGRTLTPDDDRRGCGSPPAVLSYAFWQREYGGKQDILGNKITLEGYPFDIVGVTPAGFYGVDIGHFFDVATPLCSEPSIRGEDSMLDQRRGWWLASLGRLKPGVSLAQANAQMNAMSTSILESTVPSEYNPEAVKRFMQYRFGAFPASNGFSDLRGTYSSSMDSPLWILLAIAGFVLLIACANIANLMLARAGAREREIAVRFSLGASRSRLIRQLLSESILLALVGACCGALLAQWVSRFLVAYINSRGRIYLDLALDWRVLGFTAGVAMLTSIIFGLAPAFRATRVSPASVLKATGRGMTGGRERFSLRRALVISQVAFSLVLVVGALLFSRSLGKLLAVDAGFRQTGILETDLDYSKLKIAMPQRQPYKIALIERLRAIPGVQAVSSASVVPLSGYGWGDNIILAGAKERAKESPLFDRISPGYFNTMGITVLAGRDFNERDAATSQRVAIVNESFVKKILNGANPVGQHFQIEEYVGRPRPMYEIVGFVKDTKYYDLRDNFQPIVYVTTLQDDQPDQYAQLLIRSPLSLGGLTSSIKNALADISPLISIEFTPLQRNIHDSLLRDRLMATLSGFFGGLAALLAMVGLYGVISYSVARRTNEIGIRMALGAQRLNIVNMVLEEAGLLLVIGLVVGTVLALFLGKTAGTLLYGLKPHDPLTITLAALGLAGVAILASYIPARRAAGLDPMAALRYE